MIKRLFVWLLFLLLFLPTPVFPVDNTVAIRGNPVSGYVYLTETGDFVAVKRAFANATALGNTSVVAAVTGKKIRVLSVVVVGTLAATVKFQSNVTDISAGFPFAANGGFALPYNLHGYFETVAGDPLNVNLSVATPVGVQVTYVEV